LLLVAFVKNLLLAATLATMGVASSSLVWAEPGLITVEARMTEGLAVGGGQGRSVWRLAPYTIGAFAEVATVEEPWTTLYAGGYFEGGDRAAAGAALGARVRPGRGPLRFGAGVTGTVVPYTIGGATAAGAYCLEALGPQACLEAELVIFLVGDDLPDDGAAAQLQLGLEVGFDAL